MNIFRVFLLYGSVQHEESLLFPKMFFRLLLLVRVTGESTLEQLYNRFVDEKEQHIRPVTMGYYKDLWKRHLSVLANKKISQITPDELKILHKRLTLNSGKRCANQTIVLLRTIYNHFIKQNIYQGFNPGNAVQLNKQIARTRHLSGNELEAFRDAINETEDSISKFAIMMLWFTGARRRNVFSMKWEDIKLDEKLWTIPETKTQNDANVVLVNAAIDILNQLKDMRYNEYVFFSTTSKSGHIGGVRKTWEGISFDECEFKGEVDFSEAIFNEVISFKNSSFYGKTLFINTVFKSTLEFFGNVIKPNVKGEVKQV